MGDLLTCVILELIWLPFALIALLIAFFFWIRYLREQDPGQKYLEGRKTRIPLAAFILILVLGLVWMMASQYILELDCGISTFQKPTEYSIREFSDGRTEINVSFYKDGGYNSEAAISIPKKAHIKNASFEVIHPIEGEWRDDFHNLSYLSQNQGFAINEENHTLGLLTTKLEVNSSIEMSGTHTFDEVLIREGSEIRVTAEKKLKLIVKDLITIENDAGINASGRPDLEDGEIARDKGGRGDSGSGGGGGSYGGHGGDGGDDNTEKGGIGGEPFGSETNPYEIGMPGGRGGGSLSETGSGTAGAGGRGGGAIWIEANKMILKGYINADGGNGTPSSRTDGTGGGGGGSGGGIYILTNDLEFNGTISANGGKGGDDRQFMEEKSDGGGGGGSGGRIHIIYGKKTGLGTVTAYGGGQGISSDQTKSGGIGEDGTIKLENKENPAAILIHINATSNEISPDNLLGWGTFKAGTIMPLGCDLEYTIINASDGRKLCTINPKEASEGYDISNCARNASSIKLNAEAIILSFLRTPEIDYWKVSYDTSLKDFEIDLGIDQKAEYRSDALNGKTIVSDENTNPRLSDEMNRLASDCSCRGCAPTEDGCSISLRIRSLSSGGLSITKPELVYTI